MAEEGAVIGAGQPHMGKGAGGKAYVHGVSRDYETVAASQTAQALGAAGAKGDYLDHLLVIPTSTTPGVVQIKDGSDDAITVFAGGASSIADLTPILIPIRAFSRTGAWQVTTGGNLSVLAVGSFT